MLRASLSIPTRQREELIEVTHEVARLLAAAKAEDGIVTLFVPHTTAAVTVNENADPDVQRDMVAYLRRLVPQDPGFRHAEGNSDAHIKASLIGPSVQVPWIGGKLALGRWQGIYYCEFDGPRVRELHVFLA